MPGGVGRGLGEPLLELIDALALMRVAASSPSGSGLAHRIFIRVAVDEGASMTPTSLYRRCEGAVWPHSTDLSIAAA